MEILKKYLRQLKRVLLSEEESKKVVYFFLKLAREGKDLSPVIPDLIKIFSTCNTVTIMEPLANVIILNCLKKSDFKNLEVLLKREDFRTFLLDSFDSPDIGDPVPVIIKIIKKALFQNISIRRFLVLYIKKDMERLNRVIECMLKEPSVRLYVPDFLKICLILEGIDISCSLPLLADFLSEKKENVREDTSLVFSFAAEKGLSLAKVLPVLKKSLHDKNNKVCKNLGYSIALFFAKKDRLDEIDRLIKHRNYSVRDGVLRGIALHFLKSQKHNPVLLSRITIFLVDKDKRIRENTLAILEGAVSNGLDIEPEKDVFNVLLYNLKYKTKRDVILKYLYCFTGDSREKAFIVLKVIEPFTDRGIEMIDNLKKACKEIISEEHIRICTICEHIPRIGTFYYEGSLPANIKYLISLMPPDGYLKKCPQCGVYYIYDYSVEYDIVSSFETYYIRRLSPTEALKKLKGEELQLLQKDYEKIIEKNFKNLNHFHLYSRREGAWALTLHFLDRGNYEYINDLLLKHRDPSVRLETLETLEKSENIDIKPLISTLKNLLSDEDRKIRKSATCLLSFYL